MSASAKANEPSMEEILASIRRIISDDVGTENAAEAAASPAAEVVVAPPRRAAFDPFSPRPRTVPSAAPGAMSFEGRRPAEAEPAGAGRSEDLDEPFAAALMDLAMVEQAVQAELAAVSSSDLFAEALSDIAAESEPADLNSAAADPVAVPAVEAEAVEAEAESPAAATATTLDPDVPEALMQPQAKPAAASAAVPAATPAAAPRAPTGPAPAAVSDARPAASRAAEPVAAETARPERLVSGTTNTAVSAAFGSLARSVASNSRSVEDVVTEAIRPMLKSWLDENLPALVERLVRAEIERVARQG